MVLRNLFDNYMEFEEIIKSERDGRIDLKGVKLNPTVLLLLAFYAKNNDKSLLNKCDEVLFIKLPESKHEQQDMSFLDGIVSEVDVAYGGNFVLRHILSELT